MYGTLEKIARRCSHSNHPHDAVGSGMNSSHPCEWPATNLIVLVKQNNEIVGLEVGFSLFPLGPLLEGVQIFAVPT